MPSSGYSPLLNLTNRDMSPEQALRIWQEQMCEVYFRLEIRQQGDSPLYGGLRKRAFAEAEVSWLACQPQRVTRSKTTIRGDASESFCFVFPTRGRFAYRQRGREHTAHCGDMYILNAQEVYEVDLTHHPEMLCLTLPSEIVRDRIGHVDDLCGKAGLADPMLTSTLRHIVQGTLDYTPSADPTQMQEVFLQIAEIMLVRDAPVADRVWFGRAHLLINRARDIMSARYADHGLDIASTAAACRSSVRLLQAAFQSLDTTFSAELLNIRLDAALRLLHSPPQNPSIGDIAIKCGFLNQSHFSTSFKRRFGRTPREELPPSPKGQRRDQI